MMSNVKSYVDNLVIKLKQSGQFNEVKFYKAYDGAVVQTRITVPYVSVGVGEIIRENQILSIDSQSLGVQKFEIILRVSAQTDSELTLLCERLERSLFLLGVPITSTKICRIDFSEDTQAIYRKIVAMVSIYE